MTTRALRTTRVKGIAALKHTGAVTDAPGAGFEDWKTTVKRVAR